MIETPLDQFRSVKAARKTLVLLIEELENQKRSTELEQVLFKLKEAWGWQQQELFRLARENPNYLEESTNNDN